MRRQKNARIALVLAAVACGMVALAFAAVPLYRLFCQLTGYGGTTQVSASAPAAISDREIVVRLDANVHPGLPWAFQPEVRQVKLKVGEQGLVFYQARNLAKVATAGVATFNVTPLQAGQYFNKVQCFCFDEQRLEPGAAVDMGVSFFVDPAMLADPEMDGVHTITLSYTFFAAPEEEGDDDQGAARRTTELR
ncbi:MAG TPA: cytochrome c oxidase assembly protein [Kiloniellales bacterium]|nr:cytochrome c oxidase assembly protein [Kiloniellales bacterium]